MADGDDDAAEWEEMFGEKKPEPETQEAAQPEPEAAAAAEAEPVGEADDDDEDDEEEESDEEDLGALKLVSTNKQREELGTNKEYVRPGYVVPEKPKSAAPAEDGAAAEGAAEAPKKDEDAVPEQPAQEMSFAISTQKQVTIKSVFEIDIDHLEEKPWREPGAVLSDYFNYDFNEENWRMYCQHQVEKREEQLLAKGIQQFGSRPAPKPQPMGPSPWNHPQPDQAPGGSSITVLTGSDGPAVKQEPWQEHARSPGGGKGGWQGPQWNNQGRPGQWHGDSWGGNNWGGKGGKGGPEPPGNWGGKGGQPPGGNNTNWGGGAKGGQQPWGPPGGNNWQQGKGKGGGKGEWWPQSPQGGKGAWNESPRGEPPRGEPPRAEPPRAEPPRGEPPSSSRDQHRDSRHGEPRDRDQRHDASRDSRHDAPRDSRDRDSRHDAPRESRDRDSRREEPRDRDSRDSRRDHRDDHRDSRREHREERREHRDEHRDRDEREDRKRRRY